MTGGVIIMIDENTFHLISQLLKCRDEAKRIYGDKYESRVKRYIDLIEKERDRFGTRNPLECAMGIAARHPDLISAGTFMLLMSAAIEIKPQWDGL